MKPMSLVVVAALCAIAGAQDATQSAHMTIDVTRLRGIPVLSDGRYKPLDAHARQAVRSICGTESPKRLTPDQKEQGIDPLVLFLQWAFDPTTERTVRQIAVPDAKIRKLITPGRNEKDTLYSYDELSLNETLAKEMTRIAGLSQEARKTIDNDIALVMSRVNQFGLHSGAAPDWATVAEDLRGGAPIVPNPEAPKENIEYRWGYVGTAERFGYPPEKAGAVTDAWRAVKRAFLVNDQAALDAAADKLSTALGALNAPRTYDPAKISLEVTYWLAGRLAKARGLLLAAFFISVVFLFVKNRWVGLLSAALAATGLVYHVIDSVQRTTLSGQALIGNLYESLVFIGGIASVAALVFEIKFRSGWFLMVGTLLSVVALSIALEFPLDLDPGIRGLKPVLINNFWIHIHVPTMMASYATLLLATLMANAWLVMRLFRSENHPAMKALASFCYWILPPGVILLFAGIILGGIWADASWGRFWGFDPKENAALATWLVFLVVVHARWTGWLRDFGTSMGCVAGGLAIVYTYYGVNFLKKGLHSYAGAANESADLSSIPKPLWIYLGVQLLIVILASIRRASTRTMVVGTDRSHDEDIETTVAESPKTVSERLARPS